MLYLNTSAQCILINIIRDRLFKITKDFVYGKLDMMVFGNNILKI